MSNSSIISDMLKDSDVSEIINKCIESNIGMLKNQLSEHVNDSIIKKLNEFYMAPDLLKDEELFDMKNHSIDGECGDFFWSCDFSGLNRVNETVKLYFSKSKVIRQHHCSGRLSSYEYVKYEHNIPKIALYVIKSITKHRDKFFTHLATLSTENPQLFMHPSAKFEAICQKEYAIIKQSKEETEKLKKSLTDEIEIHKNKTNYYTDLEKKHEEYLILKQKLDDDLKKLKLAKLKIDNERKQLENEKLEFEKIKQQHEEESFDVDDFLKS